MIADQFYLRLAAQLALSCPRSETAFAVGAVIVSHSGAIIATGYSREMGEGWHAEEVAIEKAKRAGADLTQTVIYSSLEPCGKRLSRPLSCAHLIHQAGIPRVVYGVSEPPTFVDGNGAAILKQYGIELLQCQGVTRKFWEANQHLLPRQPATGNPAKRAAC